MYLFHLMTDIYHFEIRVFDETDDRYHSSLKSSVCHSSDVPASYWMVGDCVLVDGGDGGVGGGSTAPH